MRLSTFPPGSVIDQGELDGAAGSDLIVAAEEGELSVLWFEGRELVVISLGELRGGASPGDLDGDGIDELVTHAPGVLSIHSLDTNPATLETLELPVSVEDVAPVVLARSWGTQIVLAGLTPDYLLATLDLSGTEPVYNEDSGVTNYFSRPFVGDFDGDGEPDTTFYERNGTGGWLYLSREGRKHTSGPLAPVVARDLDEDGSDELLTRRGLVYGTGRHHTWEELPQVARRVFPTRDAVCPILTAANYDGLGPLALAELEGGEWTRSPYLRVWSDEFVPHYLGDFDGDQRCDLLLRDYTGQMWVAWGV